MTVNTSPHAQKIIEAKALGMSRAEIAEMLNITPKSVSRAAPVFGRAHKYSSDLIQQIVDEYVGGDSLAIIQNKHKLTRGQIAGILNRAGGFAKRGKPIGKKRSVPVVKVKRIYLPKIKAVPFKPRKAEVVPLNIPFLDRQKDQCAFLYGDDPRTMTCCGQPAYGSGSWCDAHTQIVFQPYEARHRAPRPR